MILSTNYIKSGLVYTLILVGLSHFNGISQNLVPNPGMEDTIYCPSGNSQMDAVEFWQKPITGSASTGTSDYYNLCGWQSNLPHTDKGHCGFITYINFFPNAREYIQVQLDQPLDNNSCYVAEMWVRTEPGSGYLMTDLGMYFSNTAPASPGGTIINVIPQVNTTTTIGSAWTLVRDTFPAMGGGQEWLTIGVFLDDASVASIVPTGSSGLGCKFMVDDVSVTKLNIDTIGIDQIGDTIVCPGQLITYAPPSGYGGIYRWYDLSSGLPVSTGDTLNFIPSASGSYVLMIGEMCTDYYTDTFNIDVFNVSSVNGGPDQFVCEGLNVTLSASGSTNYSWDNGVIDATAFLPPLGNTTYTVTAIDVNNCENSDQVDVVVYPMPIINMSSDTTINYGETIELSSSGGTTYNWSPSNDLSCLNCQNPIASPNVSSWYYVTVVDANGCEKIDSVYVEVNNNNLWLPNIFSPNNDLLNDKLFVHGSGSSSSFLFIIYNRWGEVVFESTDPSIGWDGTYKGKEMNDGVFAYMVKATFTDGSEASIKGTVTLVK